MVSSSHTVHDPEAYACISHQMEDCMLLCTRYCPSTSLAQPGRVLAGGCLKASAASPCTVCKFTPTPYSLTRHDPRSFSQDQLGCAKGKVPTGRPALCPVYWCRRGPAPQQPCTLKEWGLHTEGPTGLQPPSPGLGWARH